MDEGWIVAWLALALALILIALAAAAEVSLGAISRANIRRLLDDGISRAQALQTLLDDPPRFILALMVLEILALVLVTSAAGFLALGVVALGQHMAAKGDLAGAALLA